MRSEESKTKPKFKSNPKVTKDQPPPFNAAWIDELCRGCRTQEDLFGPQGAFTRLKGAVMQRLLEAEMSEHLGYDKHEASGRGSGNSRNGHSAKVVHTESGAMPVQVPRDREGTFEPQVIPKHQRRLDGFDEKVLALYARGLSMRDIQGHLRELYGTDVSPELISAATDGVLEEMRSWQSRSLEAVYPIVYLDALFISVREGGHVQKKAFYLALGVQANGARDVLGIWAAEAEGAKRWLTVLTELKNRGIQDIFFVCCDGLSGFEQAITAAFPRAVVQTCIVHMIRASLRYVPWSDRKHVVAALRPVYSAENEAAASDALDSFEKLFGKKYPIIVRMWRNRWTEVTPFLAYPTEIRKVLYTTNAIESLNFQLRKVLRNRGAFPNDEAVFKLLFLAIRNAQTKWNPSPNWLRSLAHFEIVFNGRLPA